jgi:hypothetical protein
MVSVKKSCRFLLLFARRVVGGRPVFHPENRVAPDRHREAEAGIDS